MRAADGQQNFGNTHGVGQEAPSWGIGINSIPGGHTLVFADKIMVTGICLESAHDSPSFIKSVHEALRNEDKYDKKRRSGECRNYSLEDDRLICKFDYCFDEEAEQLNLARENVEQVWRHPFTGVGMLTLTDESIIELPDETAFAAISEWFGQQA